MKIDERIQHAIIRLMNYYPAVSPIMMSWDIQEYNEAVPTMGTDYIHMYYNTEYLDKLNRDQVPAVVLHEVFHCVFLHPSSFATLEQEGKDKCLWDLAQEIVVNATVNELTKGTPFALPGAPFDPLKSVNIEDVLNSSGSVYFYSDYGLDHSTNEVYEELVKERSKIPKEFQTLLTIIGCSGNGNGNGTIDSNGDSEEGNSDQSQDGSGSNSNCKGNSGNKGQSSSKSNKKSPLSGDVIPSKSKEAIEKAIAVILEMQKQRGDLPANLKRLIKDLTTPKISWKKMLQGMIVRARDGLEDISRIRHNTRRDYDNDVIIPETVYRKLDEVVIVLDTSGSISQKELVDFVSELQTMEHIVDSYTVITTDAEVHEVVKVKDLRELLNKIKFEGGGGTDFRDVFEKVKKCNTMIFFTDGYATYPEDPPRYPVLWILTKDNEKPPWGNVAYIFNE